jgi:hypothetical protein
MLVVRQRRAKARRFKLQIELPKLLTRKGNCIGYGDPEQGRMEDAFAMGL